MGPDLVLLHGWGMHGGIWADWAGELSSHFRVWTVDLPGHGNSAYGGEDTLDDWATAVQAVVPVNAWWLGWSLGGLVALAALAGEENSVRGVVLLASTPVFVVKPDWEIAVDAQVFRQFARQLHNDADRTLTRFLALQVRGADHGSETLRQLRAGLRSRPQADTDALQCGLRFLQEADMRCVLETPGVPVSWLLGERDTLVPAQVRNGFPAIPSALIEGAGHAPFLSHPGQCRAQLECWLLKALQQAQHATD